MSTIPVPELGDLSLIQEHQVCSFKFRDPTVFNHLALFWLEGYLELVILRERG